MFDVGFAEIFLLALIGLLVLGPERLPGVARTVGGFVRKARASWVSLRNTIESELEEADLTAPIKQAGEEFKQASDDFKQIGRQLTESPSFNPENHKPETIEPDPSTEDVSEALPPGEAGNGKSENV